MKTRYVIYMQTGLLKTGYVSLFSKHNKEMPFDTKAKAIDLATKFRFKIIADMYCSFANWISEITCDFKYYEVKKITVPSKKFNLPSLIMFLILLKK